MPGGALQRTRAVPSCTLKPSALRTLREQQVLFEAVTATAAGDELGFQRRQIELDRALEQRVEVFERDRLRMQQMQRPQSRKRVGARPVVPDALK